MRCIWPVFVLALLLCFACTDGRAPEHRASPAITVGLGDSESQVIEKMRGIGATDVTDETKWSYTMALSCEQKYIWWKLPDSTAVVTHLSGSSQEDLTVDTIEIGERGKGTANWRSQDHQQFITSLARPPFQTD